MAFLPVNFSGPLDNAARKAAIPDEEGKGIMFMVAQEYVKKVSGKVIGKSYNPLASYPIGELFDLLAEAGEIICPGRPKEGLYRIGLQVIPKLKTVPAGSFIFSSVGNDIVKGFGITERFYRTLGPTSTGRCLEVDQHHAILEVKNIWLYTTSFHIGVLEGYIRSFGVVPTTKIEERGMFDAKYHFTW